MDYEEGWVPKHWFFHTVVLEKTLESPVDGKKTKPVNPKWYQPWIFIRTDVVNPKGYQPWIFISAVLWPPDAKSWLIGKDLDAGKDWGQEKRTTEDEMVGCHHILNGHEFEQTLGNDEGQESLTCCSPWGPKELDMTEWLNKNPVVRGSYLCGSMVKV